MVVVDLPLVPVMATMVDSMNQEASSTSPVTSTPLAAAASTGGNDGTPGDSTITSWPSKIAAGCPPSSR